MSGKTRGPLGNKRKTCGRTFHPRRGALLSEGCMWRLVYGDRSFSNISSVARTFFFFGKGNSMGLHNVKQISTEHVWVRVSGLGGRILEPCLPASPSSSLRAPLGSKKINLTSPDRDFKMPLGNNANIHRQVQVCDTHPVRYYSAGNNEAGWDPDILTLS